MTGAPAGEPGTTKNREGRVFPFTRELRAVLEAQWAATPDLQRRTGRIVPWVFPLATAAPLSRSMAPGGRPVGPLASPVASRMTFGEPRLETLSAPASRVQSR